MGGEQVVILMGDFDDKIATTKPTTAAEDGEGNSSDGEEISCKVKVVL